MYGPNHYESDDTLVSFIQMGTEIDKAAQKNGWPRHEFVESVMKDSQEMNSGVEAVEFDALRDPSIISRLGE
jgi:hypothetical protein